MNNQPNKITSEQQLGRDRGIVFLDYNNSYTLNRLNIEIQFITAFKATSLVTLLLVCLSAYNYNHQTITQNINNGFILELTKFKILIVMVVFITKFKTICLFAGGILVT